MRWLLVALVVCVTGCGEEKPRYSLSDYNSAQQIYDRELKKLAQLKQKHEEFAEKAFKLALKDFAGTSLEALNRESKLKRKMADIDPDMTPEKKLKMLENNQKKLGEFKKKAEKFIANCKNPKTKAGKIYKEILDSRWTIEALEKQKKKVQKAKARLNKIENYIGSKD